MRILFISAAAAITLAACNSASKKGNTVVAPPTPNTAAVSMPAPVPHGPLSEVLSGYLRLKNALAEDNGDEASKAGGAIVEALGKVDVHALPVAQQKVYQNELADLKENAEHIAANAGKIAHQREHFEFLSQDVYTLMKAGTPEAHLYKDFCPMYNNEKGAFWISETKAIKNPYLGRKMTDCGEMQEEIK